MRHAQLGFLPALRAWVWGCFTQSTTDNGVDIADGSNIAALETQESGTMETQETLARAGQLSPEARSTSETQAELDRRLLHSLAQRLHSLAQRCSRTLDAPCEDARVWAGLPPELLAHCGVRVRRLSRGLRALHDQHATHLSLRQPANARSCALGLRLLDRMRALTHLEYSLDPLDQEVDLGHRPALVYLKLHGGMHRAPTCSHCPNLKRLEVAGLVQAVINLDPLLSGCPNLTTLVIARSDVAADLSQLPQLKELAIRHTCSCGGPFTLDVSRNSQLKYLHCEDTRLQRVELGAAAATLRHICLRESMVSCLDLSGCTQLRHLDMGVNRTKGPRALDASDCHQLEHLDVSYNAGLGQLVVGLCGRLRWLDCTGTKITDLKLGSATTSLTHLNCSGCPLTELQLDGCTQLTSLSAGCSVTLKSVHLKDCRHSLQQLNLSCCSIKHLVVEGFDQLQRLECQDMYWLSVVDLVGGPQLKHLNCSGTKVGRLDLSRCVQLEQLHCGSCGLVDLQLAGCPQLLQLVCPSNRLTALDVSACPQLQQLNVRNNRQLIQLNTDGCRQLEEVDTQVTALA